MRLPALLFVAAVAVVACSCTKEGAGAASSSANSGATTEQLPDRDPELARKLVKQGALLLDVRTVEEFAERHLDGARNVPVGELPQRMTEIDQLTGGDRGRAVVVYCRVGNRAARAKRMLKQAGYRRVSNLGGIDDWLP